MTKYVKSIKFSTSGETYVIRDAEQKDRLDTLEPAVNALDSGKQDKLTAGANITIENNVISATGGGTGAVNSVNGKTGTVVLEAADVHAATEAQGALADTAVQPADIADMETQTHASGTYQTKLTSANAGNNVQITEESGVVKISATGGGSGSANWGSIGGTLSDQTDLKNALDAKLESGDLKTINNESLAGSGNIELLTSSDLDNYYTKTEADDEFLSSNLGSENADKFLAVDTDGSLKFEDAPEAAQLEARVEVLEDDMDGLIRNDSVEVDITTTATTHETAKYATKTGGTASSASWEYYALENDGFESISYGLYSGGNMATFNFIDFYNSTTTSSASHIGEVAITALNSYITGTVEVPAGTKYITINNKRLDGSTVQTPVITGIKGVKGTVPEMQDQIAYIEQELEKLAGKSVKEGLRIAVIGDSISTRESLKTPEIVIQTEDVGVTLGAWITIYDDLPLTIGDKTFTTSDIGSYVTFTPTADDIGKRIGTEHIYSGNANVKVWWQYLADLGATMINGTYCSASMDSHEKDVQRLCTAHSWHDQQIRRLGKRIPGTMQRQAPDIILMYRGCNDMTHSPYAKLTDGYYNPSNWGYPTDDVITGGYGFKEALGVWVSKLRKVYPFAQIVFCTQNTFKRIVYNQFPTNNGDYSLPTFNKAIREAADFFGCKTIDFDKDGITFENCYPTYISDSSSIPTHPNATGHAAMALQAITDLDSKLDLFNFEPKNKMGLVDHHIITDLTDATISNTNNVYTGEKFEATLTATSGSISNVTVTMGGSVVADAYDSTTGKITVNNVNNDIFISNTVAPVAEVNLTQNLSHATSSNTTGKLPASGTSTITFTADDGYMIDTITVVVNGVDVTDTAYYNHRANGAGVKIVNPDGDVTITVATTFISENYVVLERLQGQTTPNCINTWLTGQDIHKAVTRFAFSSSVGDKNAFGIFGDILCNTGTDKVFSTGSSTGSTNVTAQASTGYYCVLDNIDQETSTIDIYAGQDNALANSLGQGTRPVTPSSSQYYVHLGLWGTNGVNYSASTEYFQFCLMYDNNNNLIHHYIPVTQVSSNRNGIYDVITKKFLCFVSAVGTFHDLTQNLTHIVSSSPNKLENNKAAHIVLTADEGYMIDTVTVTMGGNDITDSVFEYYTNDAVIDIPTVTDNVTITATATLVNSDYRVLKELYGQEDKFVETGLTYDQIGRFTYKIHAVDPRDRQGQGIYGYTFACEINDPTLDLLVFAATGAPASISQYRITNITTGNRYLVDITAVSSGTSTITMYDGMDTTMSTALGSTQRVHGSVNHTLTWCGFNKVDGTTADPVKYDCTGEPLCYGKVYDTTNTLSHHYIPVVKLSTGEEGVYDIIANAFIGFSTVTNN